MKTSTYDRINLFMNRIFGLFAFLLCIPSIIICSILITLTTGELPIFIQKRVGYQGKDFNIYKLRTFKGGEISPIGKYLRKFRLDEFPQFLNIFFGQMVVCGPRPIVREEYDIYGYDLEKRTQVRPGITGWAQINGPLERIEDKMDYDLYYINNRSLKMDAFIIYNTAKVIFTGKRLGDSKKESSKKEEEDKQDK